MNSTKAGNSVSRKSFASNELISFNFELELQSSVGGVGNAERKKLIINAT
jgi:hypothetical protein